MGPALLGASQAHRVLPGPGFAAALVVFDPNTTAATTSRQAAPGRGDFCGDEERSTGVGARQRASWTDSPILSERSARPEGHGAK